MTVCSNLNIQCTSGTPKILKQLGKIKNLYRKTVQKVLEPFDIPVKNINRALQPKILFCTAQTNKQFKHPKGKSWHIIFIIQWNCTGGVIIFVEKLL